MRLFRLSASSRSRGGGIASERGNTPAARGTPNTVNALRNKRSEIVGDIDLHSQEIERRRATHRRAGSFLAVHVADKSEGHVVFVPWDESLDDAPESNQ
jgi:hypothetical protein